MLCKILLLNGEEYEVTIDKCSSGQLLYERVCDYLDLLERDYFGLQYKDDLDPENVKYWLDFNKKITKQKKRGKMEFEFAVKFYPPRPNPTYRKSYKATHAMLGSYAVQTDIGDYDPVDHGTGIDYIRDMPFAPDQTDDLLYKIAALHKQHNKKIALYGVDLHKAKDSDYVDILLGVGSTGISIYRDNLRINRFVWPKILKISYRRNKFLLQIRPAEFETYESWVAFRQPNNKMAKRIWKISVEHHAFLRMGYRRLHHHRIFMQLEAALFKDVLKHYVLNIGESVMEQVEIVLKTVLVYLSENPIHVLMPVTGWQDTGMDSEYPEKRVTPRNTVDMKFCNVKNRYVVRKDSDVPFPRDFYEVSPQMEIDGIRLWLRRVTNFSTSIVGALIVRYRPSSLCPPTGITDHGDDVDKQNGRKFRDDWTVESVQLESGEYITGVKVNTDNHFIYGIRFYTDRCRQVGHAGDSRVRHEMEIAPDLECFRLGAICCDERNYMGETVIFNLVLRWVRSAEICVVCDLFEVVVDIFEVVCDLFEVVCDLFEVVCDLFEVVNDLFEVVCDLFEVVINLSNGVHCYPR
ncbi:hypothetical protein Btru_040385 [Bulinus truncatus]|nr:hypothetical protein Btru_040385 [Bulinus truncatus]